MLKNSDNFSRACVILLLDGKACHRLWCDQIVRDAIARWVMHMYVLHFACASDNSYPRYIRTCIEARKIIERFQAWIIAFNCYANYFLAILRGLYWNTNIYLKITEITNREKTNLSRKSIESNNYVCIMELISTRWIYFSKQSNFVSSWI